MATVPPSLCAGCHAPLAPGATFCGACGRPAGAAPQQPPPGWAGAAPAGYDAIILPGPPEQAMPRIAAALAQAGVQTLGQSGFSTSFRHSGSFCARLTGEVLPRPDGRGNTAVTATLQIDQNSFLLTSALMLIFGCGLSLMLFGFLAWIAILGNVGIVAALYVVSGSERDKVLQRVTASLRQAAAMPAAGPAPGFATPGFTPPPPPAPPPPATPASTPVERLRSLAAQRDQGTITPEEFERLKAAILGQLH